MRKTGYKIMVLLLTLVLLLGVVCGLTVAYTVTSSGPIVNMFVPVTESAGPSTEPTTGSTGPSTETAEPSVKPPEPSVQPTESSAAPSVTETQATEPVTETTRPAGAKDPQTGDPGYVVFFAALAALSLGVLLLLLVCGRYWKRDGNGQC